MEAANLHIHYTDSLEGITPERLGSGFWVEFLTPPSPENHLRILQNSYKVFLAIDGETGQVVGFINAISDGVYAAYIPLLEIIPEYQGRGIGSELARRMLAALRHCYQIDLLCDAHLQPFYEQLGMRPATGMMIRNYDRQAAEPL